MLYMQHLFLYLWLFCLSIGHADTIKTNNTAYRNFWHPTYQGNRLAYCDEDGCGQCVADKFCQLVGYEYSNRHIMEHNVGLTHSLTNRQRCTGWECDGFMLINCACDLSHEPPKAYHYREQEFVFPRFNDYRLDWCYKAGCGCGARAANAFCSHLGYLKAVHFEPDSETQATKAIGNQELCFGHHCQAFKTIVCFR